MLQTIKLNHFYGQSHTLWDVSMQVPTGQCTCVMGRNGVGKTTLMQCLTGLEPSHSGQILIDGVDMASQEAERRAGSGVAYVPQGRQIFPQLTVLENLRTGLYATRSKNKKDIPENLYELFPVLKDMQKRRGGDLSGGQQQQLAIARALVLDPSLLILDEPTEGIQPSIVQDIGTIIRRLVDERSLTVILVEQKLPFARRVADRFFILDRGRGVANGDIASLDEKLIDEYLTV